jgi:bifunctional DNase/RNase
LSCHDNGTDRTCGILAGKRGLRGHGFRVFSFLVVLADDTGGRALPVWLNGPEGHGLFRGEGNHPHPDPAEAITAELLRTAGVVVTGVGVDELDAALTAGPRHGRDGPRPPARIEFTTAGAAGPRQMTARIGYALALAAATGAPIQVADQVMDQLAVSAQDDLLGQFTRDVPLPRPKHHRFARLFQGHPRTA